MYNRKKGNIKIRVTKRDFNYEDAEFICLEYSLFLKNGTLNLLNPKVDVFQDVLPL
jgi:hypothetical protein